LLHVPLPPVNVWPTVGVPDDRRRRCVDGRGLGRGPAEAETSCKREQQGGGQRNERSLGVLHLDSPPWDFKNTETTLDAEFDQPGCLRHND